MALLTALLQGATPAERKVGIHPVTGWGGQELVGAVLSSGPKRWALMVGLNHSSPLPTHQHMLDYLWQRNLRQFIYKVGRTRPGTPLPTLLLASPHSQPWTGCPSEHHPQCSATGRRDGSPPVRTAGPDAGAAGATHADTTGPLQSGRCLERAEGWGWPEFGLESSILPPLPTMTPGAAGAAAGPAPSCL